MQQPPNTQIQPGYAIKTIVLIESSFSRLPIIDFQTPIDNHLDLKSEHNVIDANNQFTLFLTGDLKGKQGDTIVMSLIVKIAALFEKIGEPELLLETFIAINAPAIIFPYLREFISDITRRSGMTQLFIPPMNFTAKKLD